MDDWVILAPTRWKLRAAIKTVNQCLNDLRFEKHPDKAYIGRIAHGFDLLGFYFSVIHNSKISSEDNSLVTDNTPNSKHLQPSQINPTTNEKPSPLSLQKYRTKLAQLYEQNASYEHIGQYQVRWRAWVQSHVRFVFAPRVTSQGG